MCPDPTQTPDVFEVATNAKTAFRAYRAAESDTVRRLGYILYLTYGSEVKAVEKVTLHFPCSLITCNFLL